MGWTFLEATHYTPAGKVDRKAECRAYFEEGLNRGYYEILADSMHGTVYYAAVQQVKTGDVFAAIVLTDVDNYSYCNFGYKAMSEDVEPYYYDCPARLLNLLSETDSGTALEWRALCRSRIARNKARNALKVGSVIEFTTPDGKTVTAVKHPAAYQFKRPFWFVPAEGRYIKRGQIPDNYKVIKNGEEG